MRLSEAIALGRTLITPRRFCESPTQSGSRDPRKEGHGCALDMAVVAVQGEGNWHSAPKIWPWLLTPIEGPHDGAGDYLFEIAYKFDFKVCSTREMNLDQLIDYVRSVEPAEPAIEPQSELSKRIEADRELRAVEYGAGDEPCY